MAENISVVMTKKEFTIVRFSYDPKGTPGEFKLAENKLFSTLEPPRDRKNYPCIPEGRYLCVKYSSEEYPDTWEITGVKGRSKVLLHSLNCIDETKGCIGIGEKFANNITHPKTGIVYKYWLMSSRAAMKQFQQFMPDEFYVNITSNDTLCNVPKNIKSV